MVYRQLTIGVRFLATGACVWPDVSAITVDGFRDLLEIVRQKRPDLYDIQVDKRGVLVSRDLRMEVPLDENAVRAAVRHLRRGGVAAIADCFLYGFVAEKHEAIAARILTDEFPEGFASDQHRVVPEFREFERMATAIVKASLCPVMQAYIRRLDERLVGLGLTAAANRTQSNGGVRSGDDGNGARYHFGRDRKHRAIRVISVRRGYDPRDYTLVPFGVASPMLAARPARELEISRILVPVAAGDPVRDGPEADRSPHRRRGHLFGPAE